MLFQLHVVFVGEQAADKDYERLDCDRCPCKGAVHGWVVASTPNVLLQDVIWNFVEQEVKDKAVV